MANLDVGQLGSAFNAEQNAPIAVEIDQTEALHPLPETYSWGV